MLTTLYTLFSSQPNTSIIYNKLFTFLMFTSVHTRSVHFTRSDTVYHFININLF